MIDALLLEVDELFGKMKKVKSVNVNSKALKGAITELTKRYFQDVRPKIVTPVTTEGELAEIDATWQELFRLAHGNNAKTSYLRHLRKLQGCLKVLSIKSVRVVMPNVRTEPLSDTEVMIIESLSQIVPSAGASYKQGVLDLASVQGRLSYRGTASEFREALREVLDTLAHDEVVEREPGFQCEQGRNGPTMKQKVLFILKTRGRNKTQMLAPKNALDAVETILASLARSVYERASVSSHAATTKLEVARLKNYLDAVLLDVLELPTN